MNIATTRGQTKTMSLPNILTYARIAAIPVVIGCVYWQSILDGPLWLRWVALAVFIAAGITDYLDGYYAGCGTSSPRSAGCSIRSPTSCWWPPAS